MATLIRADLQKRGGDNAVEAGPVEAVVGVVHFAGGGRHQRDLIGFTFAERRDGAGEIGI